MAWLVGVNRVRLIVIVQEAGPVIFEELLLTDVRRELGFIAAEGYIHRTA
jgi:hypothetical protein